MLRLRDGPYELVEVIVVLGILGVACFLVLIVLVVVLVSVIRGGLLDALGGADADAETRSGRDVVEVGELLLGRADARELADILRDVVNEARSEDQLDAVEAHPADAEHAADVGERLAVDGGDVVDEEPQARGADAAGAYVALASQRPEDQFGDILAAHMVATFRWHGGDLSRLRPAPAPGSGNLRTVSSAARKRGSVRCRARRGSPPHRLGRIRWSRSSGLPRCGTSASGAVRAPRR